MRVLVFRGQGVRVGNRFAVVHKFVSPTEVEVRFKEGFEIVCIADLLPVAQIEEVARRYNEEIEIDLGSPDRGKFEPEAWEQEEREEHEMEIKEEADAVMSAEVE